MRGVRKHTLIPPFYSQEEGDLGLIKAHMGPKMEGSGMFQIILEKS